MSQLSAALFCNEYLARQEQQPVTIRILKKMLIRDLVSNFRNSYLSLHIINKIPENKLKDCAVHSNCSVRDARRKTMFLCETYPRKPVLHSEN